MVNWKDFDTVLRKIISNKIFVYHVLAWIVYFSLTNLNYYLGSGGETLFLSIFLHMFLAGGIIFYGNVFFVCPYFLPKKQYLGQILGVLLLIFIFGISRYALDFYLLPALGTKFPLYVSLDRAFLYDTGWFAIQYLLLSFGYWFTLNSIKMEQQKRRIVQQLADYERKINQLEMDFLRQQISPHFMYNVLSSVYTKLNKHSPELAESIILLSELMSYSTKVSKSNEEVLLEEELENIERFIALEGFRYDNNIHINYTVTGFPDSNDSILPLLLLTFIENSFKYGERNNPERPIEISISIDDNYLIFNCKNYIQRISTGKIKKNSVGLSNTKRRLEITYPNSHELIINNNNNTFSVYLKLSLNH